MTARVVVVGGGFSGAVAAMRMLRRAREPIAVAVAEPRALLGGGVAYSATDPAHRINVPASRMTVFNEDPEHFDRWARANGVPDADPAALRGADAYPGRAVFGRYLAAMLADAAAARPDAVLVHHRATAVAVVARERGGFAVRLADGTALDADAVVLATSHPPPAVPGALRNAMAAGGRVVADPWAPGALDAIPGNHDVLIVGTGLTMADVVATLDRRGHAGRVLALSRRGLCSREHAAGTAARRDRFGAGTPPDTAGALCRAVRAEVRRAAAEGAPWQAVFDDVRRHARRLWDALDREERRRVVRHLRPFWDVHRFRVAPPVAEAAARMRADGRLRTIAARLSGADAAADGTGAVEVRFRERGRDADTGFRAGTVVVTTGPAHGAALRNPALAGLAAAGLLREDGIGLGLLVDEESRAVAADGTARTDLFVAGPLARGRFGELMGLPQVSEHATAVGDAVLALLEGVSAAG